VNVGATIKEDLSEASVIVGVKQVPIDALIPEKTYAFFSHTIKAQDANMALLDAILEKVSVVELFIIFLSSNYSIILYFQIKFYKRASK
jgi:hypothetical protein